MGDRHLEAEPAVVPGAPQQNDDGVAVFLAPVQGIPHQLAADALVLIIGQDGQGRQGQGRVGDLPVHDLNGGEEKVAHRFLVLLGHQGKVGEKVCLFPQLVHQPGFVRPAEGQLVDVAHGAVLGAGLGAEDQHGGHSFSEK